MNTFVDAVVNQEARTTNGMKARKSSANAVVDLFYNIGASREIGRARLNSSHTDISRMPSSA